ncbi:M56 family metallopeptidase [uncultured Aquimarina sp.]|uniref:M56 family metallopeptidase n=1 Tax=uncultured Aquimarina sp. TaxID=575652 RepID=UPI00261D08EB|nr:M56 family metallopeptidase [uncultured Aquimarina sp.]
MFHYLLQVLIFQLLFLVIYDVLHKKDTFFNWNRLYLLVAPFLSLILPFIELDFLNSSSAEIYVSNIERTIIASTETIITNINQTEATTQTSSHSVNWLMIIYAFGILISLVHLILKFHKLHILRNVSNISKVFDKRIVILPNSSHAFSFWNTIFLGDSLTDEEKKNIISHELVHVNHKHTIDQIGIEILKILLWWNPLVYIYQARITLLHEYIADSVTISKVNQRNYIEQLLNAAFQTEKITFINQFFNQSLIKKRILMLQKSQSKSIAKFKYLLLIPVITGILTYTSCKDSEGAPSNPPSTTQENENIMENDVSVRNQPDCLNKDSKYDYKLDNYLKITTGENSEILAKIVSLETSEVIRKAVIPRSQTFFIRHIPEGVYRIDVVYGEEYAEKDVDGSCTGFFKKELLFEQGEDILDFTAIVTDQGKNVPSYSLEIDFIPRDSQNKNDHSLSTINTGGDEKSLEVAQKLAEQYRDKISPRANEISQKEVEPHCANQGDTKYDYKIDNYLKFTSGKNADIIVDIVSNENAEVVRTLYLPKNKQYYARNIPGGTYHLKIIYGEGYQENSKDGKCELSFKKKLMVEKGEDILDFNVIKTPEGINVPSYAITLDMLEEHTN